MIKKTATIMASIAIMLTGAAYAVPAMAQEALPTIRVCSGVSGGNYEFVAAALKAQLKNRINVEIIPTEGGVKNFNNVLNGTCDAGPTQSDIVWQGGASKIHTLSKMYTEFGHLLCNRDSGIEQFSDLGEGAHTVYAGVEGSGADATLRGLKRADKEFGGDDYAELAIVNEDNDVSLADITEGEKASCLFYTGAPGNDLMKNSAEKRKDTLVLVPIVDKDFNDTTYKDKEGKAQSVWNPVVLDSSSYGGIMPSGVFGNKDLDTIGVTSQFIVSSDWRSANTKAYGKLSDALLDVKNLVKAQRGLELIK